MPQTKRLRLAEADVSRSRDRFDAGLVVQSDLLAAEVQLAEFRQQQIQSEGDLTIAQAALNTALGLAVDTPQKVAGELVEKGFNTVSQEESIRLAMEHRPELARARLDGQSAREGIRGARGEFLPRLDVFGGFGVSGRNPAGGSSDYTVGASADVQHLRRRPKIEGSPRLMPLRTWLQPIRSTLPARSASRLCALISSTYPLESD